MLIAENIIKLEERIQRACSITGRKRDEITLMGVTKFVPVEKIEEAFCAGICCFGESRVKETAEKFETFREGHPGVQLHLIGSLQRNKAKQAALLFDCIQSIDRNELIVELAKHSSLRFCSGVSSAEPLKVLLEIHTGEETKSGFAASCAADLSVLFEAVEFILGSQNLKPAGLMTMAPFTTDTALIRTSFRQLVKVQKELEKRFSGYWDILSMGMTNDFEIAIEEGSNLLRIGSAIFAGK